MIAVWSQWSRGWSCFRPHSVITISLCLAGTTNGRSGGLFYVIYLNNVFCPLSSRRPPLSGLDWPYLININECLSRSLACCSLQLWEKPVAAWLFQTCPILQKTLLRFSVVTLLSFLQSLFSFFRYFFLHLLLPFNRCFPPSFLNLLQQMVATLAIYTGTNVVSII